MITRPFGATGVSVAVIGQGTWRMGEHAATRRAEVAALRLGIELGLTHVDSFLTRRPSLFTIPKATSPEPVRENAGALDFTLSRDEIRAIDAAF